DGADARPAQRREVGPRGGRLPPKGRPSGGDRACSLSAISTLMQGKQPPKKLPAAARHEVCPPLGRRTVNTDPLPGSVTSPPIMRASLPSSTNARHAGYLSTRQGRVRRHNA